jgi:hypothetical protein
MPTSVSIWTDAVQSLAIVLAAERSMLERRAIDL